MTDQIASPSSIAAQSGSAVATPKAGVSWTIIIFLFFFMFINFADRAVLGLAGPALMRDLELTPQQFGLVGSAFFLCYTIFAVVLGFVINRVETRWMLFVLALVWSAAQFPMMMSANFAVLLLSRMLLGAGEGPAYPAAIHSAFKWFPDEKRTLPVSVIAQGSAMGVIIAAPTLNWIINTYGWQTAFGVLGIIGVIWAAAWMAWGAEGPINTSHTAKGEELVKVPYRSLIMNPTVLTTWFGVFAAYWVLTTLIVWFPLYLLNGLGYGKSSIGLLTALPWLGGAIIIFAVGWASQKMLLGGYSSRQSRALLACGLGLCGAACLVALPLFASPLAKLIIVTIGVILPNAIIPPAQAIIGEVSPVAQRGALLSIGNAVAGSAGVCAPFVAGILVQNSATPAIGYESTFAVCGLVAGTANLLGLWLIRPQDQADALVELQARQNATS